MEFDWPVLPSRQGCLGHLEGSQDTAFSPQELEARVPEGQHLFEDLLRRKPAGGTSDEMEDLRYRWMLHKSKLKDSRLLLVGAKAAQVPGSGTGLWPSPSSHGKRRWARVHAALSRLR